MNIGKDISRFYRGEPPGERTNSIRWLQKKVMKAALALPRHFGTLAEWETFRAKMRRELPEVLGVPQFPPLQESTLRARIRVGEDLLCERVDVYVDEDYGIPALVFLPAAPASRPRPGLVWSPGWPQDKWIKSYQEFAVRMAKQGYVTIIPDHAPFGETSAAGDKAHTSMTLVMSMGHVLGISQLALRAAENMRLGEYMRARPDVDPKRVALSGLCQGGMDTWLTAGLDDRFCAMAPLLSESTFAVHMAEMASYFVNADASPFPFGILKVCDVEHLHAAVAPRPILVRANLTDQWWPISGYDDVESLTREVYRLYGAEDKVDFRAEVHEHNLTGPFADALEQWMLKYV